MSQEVVKIAGTATGEKIKIKKVQGTEVPNTPAMNRLS